MFWRLGGFSYRFRRFILVGALAVTVILVSLSGPFGGQFTSGGFSVPGSQSQDATNLLSRYFGKSATQLLLVFHSPKADAASAAVQLKVNDSFRRLARERVTASVLDYTDTGERIFIGDHGHDTFAVVNLKLSETAATSQLNHLTAYVDRPSGLKLYISGSAPIDQLYNTALEKQLQHAELIALPISLILLFLIFGSVMAALLPLVIAGLAVPTALAVIKILAAHFGMSIFVTNVATIIGLGLAIDYSLFFVKRFREEIPTHESAEAVRIATASAGKAVAVSGTAVAVGLLSLTLFPAAALGSMGVGGVIVVAFTLLFALTALPAMLGLLGPRVNWLTLRRSLRGNQPRPARTSSFWGWVARAVMRRPIVIAVPTVALLLLLGTPFFHLKLSTGTDVANIPPGEARTGYALLNYDFPQAGGVDDLNLVLKYSSSLGHRLTEPQQRQLSAYLGKLQAIPGVQGLTGALTPPPGVSKPTYLKQLALPAKQRSSRINSYIAGNLAGPIAQFEVANDFSPDSNSAATLVHRLRTLPGPTGSQALVTGGAALSVDFLQAFGSTIPWAVLLVVVVTMVVLFLTFGSILLPLKAVLMSLISISAAFGAMVWIFQEGHLANVLKFTPAGNITATTPVLMFAILFGLSMDYEVFLLSRIRERYCEVGDNREAVAHGLTVTGGVITSAALIMITVFSSFAAGDVLEIQTLGVGMAVAVAVDATLVRGILVPALMRLLGRANWWAPPALQGWVAKLGLYEREAVPEIPAAA
ncbi:MAG TPA: MMPL family transporter [Candidatus Dormibacteraeota bacterium]|nr:MMPL family transporter [Candidatus Dormibacteraeota bacterium]